MYIASRQPEAWYSAEDRAVGQRVAVTCGPERHARKVVVRFGQRCAHPGSDGGKQVDQRDRLPNDFAPGDVGSGHEERDRGGALVHQVLAPHPVVAQHLAVIACVNDPGRAFQPLLGQRPQHRPDLAV